MIYLAAWAVSFVLVFFKSSQQLNVVYLKWIRVPPFSYAMAYSEYFMMGYAGTFIVAGDWFGFLLYGFAGGTGGWMGCYLGMYQHKRWQERQQNE